MSYQEFLARKSQDDSGCGFAPMFMPDFLFPFQASLVDWAVRKGKAYVSFHLMSVYAYPKLLQDISPELKKRMQGKACFNFKAVDEKLFKELAKLTKAGATRFSDGKFIDSLRKAQGAP